MTRKQLQAEIHRRATRRSMLRLVYPKTDAERNEVKRLTEELDRLYEELRALGRPDPDEVLRRAVIADRMEKGFGALGRGRTVCETCGKSVKLREDGTLQRHVCAPDRQIAATA